MHALRPEAHDGRAIRDVVISPGDDGTITIHVTVPPDVEPGTYNAMIIDLESNLPRGTLSVRVSDKRD